MKGKGITRREALLAAGGSAGFARGAARRPNIVFVLADDLGYADLSCYGRRDYQTPHLDNLAAGGVRFTQAYASSCVCSATRTALLTGRYQYRLPVGLEEPVVPARHVGMPREHPTLPSLLKKAGYGTTLIGKWHLGSLPDYGPRQSGYDHFWGVRGSSVDYFTHRIGAAETDEEDLWDGETRIHQAGYLTNLLGDKAVETVHRYAREKRPFLLSLHFTAPHWPWEGPEDAAESRRIKALIDFDGGSPATYGKMVRQMDLQVGRVMRALEETRLANDTIVIFTSDNGGERFSDTWPFTGKKTDLLEGGLRIPAILRWPGRVKAGRATDQVTVSMDWLPTLLEAAAAKVDEHYPSDGWSVLKTVAEGAQPVPRKLFWRYRWNGQRAVRDGDMKWLKIRENQFLFNVAEDPLERANLKEREPETFRRLAGEWDAWNATMLPEEPKATSHTLFDDQLADHYGNRRK